MVSPKTLHEYEKPLGIALFDLDFEEKEKITKYWCDRISHLSSEFEEVDAIIRHKDYKPTKYYENLT